MLVAELRRHLEGGAGATSEEKFKIGREVAELMREETLLLVLRQKDTEGLIDENIFFGQFAPVRAIQDEKQRALALLEEQERSRDDAALDQGRIVEMCERVSSKLDGLDFQGKRAVMEAFGVKIHVIRDDFRLVMEVSPEVTTIEQTLA